MSLPQNVVIHMLSLGCTVKHKDLATGEIQQVKDVVPKAEGHLQCYYASNNESKVYNVLSYMRKFPDLMCYRIEYTREEPARKEP